MAAMDVEEQQQLLENTAPARRPIGRTLAWAAVALGATAAAAVRVHALATPSVQTAPAAAPHDAFAESLQQLSASFAKIRMMTEKDAAAAAAELKTIECDVDQLDMDLCGAEEALMTTKCTQQCVGTYNELLAACGPNHSKSKALTDRLAACAGYLDASPAPAEAQAVSTTPKLAEDRVALELKCAPLMHKMVTECHMHEAPKPKVLCQDPCQSAYSSLEKDCAEVLKGVLPPQFMSSMCNGCGQALIQLAAPKAKGNEQCGLKPGTFQAGDFDACDKACHPFVCGVVKSCPAGQDSEIPFFTVKVVGKVRAKIAEKTAKCAC